MSKILNVRSSPVFPVSFRSLHFPYSALFPVLIKQHALLLLHWAGVHLPEGQKFLFLYNYYDSISPVTCSNFTCDIKPQYLFIVENYPHLIRNGMRASQKTVSIKMRLNFCSANFTLIDPTNVSENSDDH